MDTNGSSGRDKTYMLQLYKKLVIQLPRTILITSILRPGLNRVNILIILLNSVSDKRFSVAT